MEGRHKIPLFRMGDDDLWASTERVKDMEEVLADHDELEDESGLEEWDFFDRGLGNDDSLPERFFIERYGLES